MAKHFGHVSGVAVGQTFDSRTALRLAGVHPPPMGGIHGTLREGADSIVVSGGYIDDVDDGDLIIYTGAGGNDPQTKRQIADQSIDQPGNAGMVTSQLHGYPVRVTRGAHPGSPHAPRSGFRYDGLYSVVNHHWRVGEDGYRIVQFRLEKLMDGTTKPESVPVSDAPKFATTTVVRRIRDSKQSRAVKAWHNDVCQVCGVVVVIDGGRRYSEGAHIRPLGTPHDGPDTTANILCLCANHHAQFDFGGLHIDEALTIRERHTSVILGVLRTVARHRLDQDALKFRRDLFPLPKGWRGDGAALP